MDWSDLTLHGLLAAATAGHENEPAVIFGEETTTFAHLWRRCEVVATALTSVTQRRDRVAIVGENHPGWLAAYYGVPRAGRVLGFLNHRLAPGELAGLIARLDARLVLGHRDDLGRIRTGAAVPADVALMDLCQWTDDLDAMGPGPESIDSPDALAWILFTSGTTGPAKAVGLTHRNLVAAVTSTDAVRPVESDDVYLFPFPLCHIAGYNALRHHAHGRPVVLMERFSAPAFVDAVQRHQVTSVSLAATMLNSVMTHLGECPSDRARLASLRLIAYGAAPMPAALLRRAHEALGVGFAQGYGMTELAGNAVFLGPDEHRAALANDDDALLRSAGYPAPGVEIRAVDDVGQIVPADTPGEIEIRAQQVTSSYIDDDDANAVAFRHGWFATGDIGRIDHDGRLTLVDRKKDIIVTGGENVSSREVEDAILATSPDIESIAVLGCPDAHWGEVVTAVAVAVADRGPDLEVLRQRLRPVLGGFKLPRQLVYVDELPLTASGKVAKHLLRQQLVARSD